MLPFYMVVIFVVILAMICDNTESVSLPFAEDQTVTEQLYIFVALTNSLTTKLAFEMFWGNNYTTEGLWQMHLQFREMLKNAPKRSRKIVLEYSIQVPAVIFFIFLFWL